MKNQLSRYRELEKQNFKLEEDNRYYRETLENNLLLKEQMESMRGKLQRADQRVKDLTRMEVENEVYLVYKICQLIFMSRIKTSSCKQEILN